MGSRAAVRRPDEGEWAETVLCAAAVNRAGKKHGGRSGVVSSDTYDSHDIDGFIAITAIGNTSDSGSACHSYNSGNTGNTCNTCDARDAFNTTRRA